MTLGKADETTLCQHYLKLVSIKLIIWLLKSSGLEIANTGPRHKPVSPFNLDKVGKSLKRAAGTQNLKGNKS